MKIIPIDPKSKKEEEQKNALLEVLEEIKEQIKEGRIKEFVACSIDSDGECQIHICTIDLPGGIGLFEIGKHLLIQAES